MKTNSAITMTLTVLMTILFSEMVFALYTPEPASGGRFFRSKGTKAAQDYLTYMEIQDRYRIPTYVKGVDLGPVHLRPYIDYTREWDSNVFLSDDNEKSDWINRLNAGGDFEIPIDGGQHLIYGGGHSATEWFSRFDDQDHSDFLFQGGFQLNFSSFRLGAQEQFERTSSRSRTEFTERTKRNENTIRGLLEVPLAQMFLETEIIDYDVDFRQSQSSQFDHHEFSVLPRVGFDLASEHQILGELGYTNLSYDNENRDGDVLAPMVGLRGKLTELISYQIWNGVQFRNYDERDNYVGYAARGALFYDTADQKSQVRLMANRQPVESTFQDNSYYVRNELDVQFRQNIGERFNVYLGWLMQFNNYEGTREDFVWEPRVRGEVFIFREIVTLFGEYRFTGRGSNTSGQDYGRHLTNFGVGMKF